MKLESNVIYLAKRDRPAINKVIRVQQQLASEGNRLRPRDLEICLDTALKHLEVASAERSEYESVSGTLEGVFRDLSRLEHDMARLDAEALQVTKQKDNLANELKQMESAASATVHGKKKLEHLLDTSLSSKGISEWAALVGGLAENSLMPLFKENYPDEDNFSEGRRIATNAGVGVKDRTIDDIQKIGTTRLSSLELGVQADQVEAAALSMEAQRQVHNAACDKIKNQQKVSELLIGGLQNAHALLLKARDRLADSTTSGVYRDMLARLSDLHERFLYSLACAQVRLEVAEQGIKEIYGTLVDISPCPGRETTLDEKLLWARTAASQVDAANRNMQEIVIVLPLLKKKGQSVHSAVLGGEPWMAGGTLMVRGVSVTLAHGVSPDLTGVAYVEAPNWHFDKLKPVVRISRLCAWSESQTPEVFGINSLYNWNPEGIWKVDYNGPSDLNGAHLHVSVSLVKRS